ncbi:UPF0348 protein family [Lachnospiraceae bacterium TWA4]|nr:UPF0348 protein family [Lachnospiraceae bacterium TWA4]
MSVVGIIAEYNPFHKGHEYQIQKIKELLHPDCIIAVMSGDFVQRGEPAIANKYLRTKMALEAGVDFVFELPVLFASSASRDFAKAGVDILHSLGCVDILCFGSEIGQLKPLEDVATILLENHLDLKEQLKQGVSYPMARNHVLSGYLEYDSSLWTSPNNLLAIEYLQALKDTGIHPFTIKREGAYHDTDIRVPFASASAIRKFLLEGNSYEDIKPLNWENFYNILCSKILENWEHLEDFKDVSKEIAGRIKKYFWQTCSVKELCDCIKNKQYTYTRIQRALLHILLGIKKKMFYDPYIRLLGFRREKANLFKQMKCPIITKLPKEPNTLLKLEIESSQLYEMVFKNTYNERNLKNEYTQGIVLV